ncbi:MAG: hypothetical protein JXR34_04535 [Bacteroidales bacterium]|nr:hypothetical protein [Bacteroidales bacterium]
MKYIVFFVLLIIAFSSCQKDNDEVQVVYAIKGFSQPYKVVYAIGDLNKTEVFNIDPAGSTSYEWKAELQAVPGKVTYLYVESDENISNVSGFHATIFVEGKVFRRAYDYDGTRQMPNDTTFYIKQFGTIPF